MKKSDKKIEKTLREALTAVCETALETTSGFVWLTHIVNFNAFPSSLKVICVFETDDDLSAANHNKQTGHLTRLILDELKAVNIVIKTPSKQISFDTEEACQRTHSGKWNERLSKL